MEMDIEKVRYNLGRLDMMREFLESRKHEISAVACQSVAEVLRTVRESLTDATGVSLP